MAFFREPAADKLSVVEARVTVTIQNTSGALAEGTTRHFVSERRITLPLILPTADR
jgi:hypothetical protein